MLFEIEEGWNASGGPELMLPRGPHAQTYNVVLADGSVMRLPPSTVSALRWEP